MKHSWEGKLTGRVIRRGDANESTWPPDFGTLDATPMHVNRETGKVEKGYPKQVKKFGKAPAIVTDGIPAYYHPGACRVTESRSELKAFDNACGTITTDKFQEAPQTRQREIVRQREKDQHEALHKAVAQLENGTAPLTEETRQLCSKKNEIIASACPGLDPFNAVGRITDERGHRFKRRKRKAA